MALTIEDGSGVAGANSYISVVNAQTWVTARGYSVTVTEALLLKAMDYLESLRDQYQGIKSDSEQALQFPRAGVYVDGFLIDDDVIPTVLISAQCQLAVDASTNGALFANSDGVGIKSESIGKGAVTVVYADGGSDSPQPRFGAAEAFLAPLLQSANSGMLRTVRV